MIECTQCHKIQVAFGMLVAGFREEAFHNFRSYIRARLAHMHPAENTHEKNIMLNTPCESLSLLLSFKELTALHRMLEQADTEMKTEKMLQLFRV